MASSDLPPLTPEQIAALTAGNGFAHVEDPETHRKYLVVDQGAAPTLAEEYVKKKVLDGISELDSGLGKTWDPDSIREQLDRRLGRDGD
jgi:hypothetical protein